MKKGILKRIISLVVAIVALLCAMYPALADVDKLVINQMVQNGGEVRLYINALNESSVPISENIAPEQISVSLNEGAILQPESAQRFLESGEGVAYTFCVDISGSVTAKEAEQIREAISDFVDGMGGNDYARIITIGEEIQVVCDFTQDTRTLKDSVDKIHNKDKKTYLYEGISYALESSRKKIIGMPKRAVIMVFTDGMDDSDRAMGYEEIIGNVASSRIPIYVSILKGNDKSANASDISRISRQSGGMTYSYSDYSIAESVEMLSASIRNSYVLLVKPEYEQFGQMNINWKVTMRSDYYSVSSANYVYSLSIENVASPTPEPTVTPVPTPVPTPDPTPTSIPTSTPAPVVSEMPLEDNTASISILDWILNIVHNYTHIVIAGLLVLLAIIIVLIVLIHNHKRQRDNGDRSYGGSPSNYQYEEEEKTSADLSDTTQADVGLNDEYLEEKTIYGDEVDYLDEKTIAEERPIGPRLALEISCNGEKYIREVVVSGEVRLERSEATRKLGIEFRDNRVSRIHAVIVDRTDGLYVRDDGSSRGTYLNGVELREGDETVIHDGDLLKLGDGGTSVRINILRV